MKTKHLIYLIDIILIGIGIKYHWFENIDTNMTLATIFIIAWIFFLVFITGFIIEHWENKLF